MQRNESEAEGLAPEAGQGASKGRRPVVLVIENKPVDATLIRFMLSESRDPTYRFLWASSLQAARGLLKNRDVDMILASLDLPDGRGLEVIHALSDCTDRLPVVALLTQRDEILGPGAVDAGAQDYLIKGQIATNLLLKTVRHAVQRKRMQIQQQRMAEEIQKAQRDQGFFAMAGGIAHDFGNLLAVILGNSQICLSHLDDSSPIRDNLTSIVKAALNAGKLTDSMLAYTGNAAYSMDECDLNEVVRHTIRLLGTDQLPRNALRLDLDEHLPGIFGDRQRLGDLLTSLVVNALEAMDDEPGELAVSTASVEQGEKVLLTVRDSGAGMSAETLARACEPFFTTKLMGRGLGLATAVGNAKAHKGSLHIESRPGEGTTVTVSFPAASQEVREAEDFDAAARENTGILVVDDEDNVREVAEDVLRGSGYEVFLAGTGRDALGVLRNHTRRIGLVILDIMLPDQDGREVFHALKSLCPDVRILLSSGKGADAVEGLRDDPAFGGFLEKPFQIDAMLESVEAVVGAGSSRAEFISEDEDPFLAGEMSDEDLFRHSWAAG